MGLLSSTEVLRLKLKAIPAKLLKYLARQNKIDGDKVNEIIDKLVLSNISVDHVDNFIKTQYALAMKHLFNETNAS